MHCNIKKINPAAYMKDEKLLIWMKKNECQILFKFEI